MANVDEMFAGARDAITVKRVYGDPIESEGVTLVPAAKVGGGGGGGGDSEHNGGGGFGLGARPVGAYVIKDGDVKWQPAVDVNRIVALGFVLGLVFALKAPTRRRRP
jgi:uncharacterized spore protein YtfJ